MCEFESRTWQKVLDATLCDTFVSNLGQVGDFLQFLPPIKLTATVIIAEILMEMALNTTTLTLLKCFFENEEEFHFHGTICHCISFSLQIVLHR